MDAEAYCIGVQGIAEGNPILRPMMDNLLDLAPLGIEVLIRVQREALACVGIKR